MAVGVYRIKMSRQLLMRLSRTQTPLLDVALPVAEFSQPRYHIILQRLQARTLAQEF